MHSPIGKSKASNHAKTRGFGGTSQFQRRILCKRKNDKKKNLEGLTAENTHLKDMIERFIAEYLQFPGSDLKKHEISDSHSAIQGHAPNIYVQDHHGQGMDSEVEGPAEDLDGFGLDDLQDDLSNEFATSQPVGHQNMTLAEFLMKIDEDVQSNIDFSDFMICLDGDEKKTIGEHSFPLSLVPTVERLINTYGDVSAPSKMNPKFTGQIYLIFCATIKEMEEHDLHQVSPEKMLKWRDAIKDALRINFNVDFAMSHLKKIARAYFGHVGSQLLQSMDEKRAETYEAFKDCLANADDFPGKSVSTGLFP